MESKVCVCVCVRARARAHARMRMQTQSLSQVRLCATLWAVAAPLSMKLSMQEYWSGLPFPPPGESSQSRDGPEPLVSLALTGRFFSTVPPGKPPHYT